MIPWNSASGGFAYISQSKWLGIIAIKTERTQIHFLSDVLVAVASLDLKVLIVGQQLPRLVDVACCVRLHTLLHVVGNCCAKFKIGQTFEPTTPNISFVPWSPKRSTTIRSSSNNRRRRLRKRHLKSKVALLQTISSLVHLVQLLKCWQLFLELNSKRLYQSSGKEKETRCLVFPPSSTKREMRHFHVVVVQRRLRNVQKSVMHVQSRCFVNLNQLLFFFAVLVAVAVVVA